MSNPNRERSRLDLFARQDQIELAAELSGRHGFGVTLVAPSDARRRLREENLVAAGERLAESIGGMPGLDANYYSGKNHRDGGSDLSANWIDLQRRSGVERPQTDPGFIGPERWDQVANVLDQSRQLEHLFGTPIRSVLALDYTFVSNHPTELSDRIEAAGLSEVSLRLGHPNDPFSVQRTAKGMLTVLALGTIAVDRTDLSAIPCLAAGAVSAGIGTTTSLRHIFTSTSNGYFASGVPSVLVPGTLAWKLQDRLNDIISRFPDQTFSNCPCANCFGRNLATALQDEEAVNAHNYNLVVDTTERVLTSPNPMQTWYSMCMSAQFRIEEVAAETEIAWTTPAYLGSWLATRPSLVGV